MSIMGFTEAEPGYWLLAGVIGLLTAWLVKHLITRPKNLPPGPTGLPLLGVAWQIFKGGSDPLALFASWSKKYGEMVSFYVGPKPIIILNSYPVIFEAFRHPDLQDRLSSRLLQEIMGLKNSGIGFSNGEVWKEQRKFTHSVFRSLGVGKKSYEDTVSAEMTQLSSVIKEKKSSPFDPSTLFMQAVSNIICSIIFGTQYTYDDEAFKEILHLVNLNVKLSGGGGSFLFLPIPGISKIPFGKMKLMTNTIRSLNAFIQSQIESHEKNWDPENQKDFIDQYLNKLDETKDTVSSFTKLNLTGCIADLFLAGSDTTATTLKWCILFMMAYPQVQSRVQDELDHVVGRERIPRLDDIKDLPYTNAVILEVQRKGVVVPLGVPHVAAADTTIRGYTIPKGAVIVSNISEVLNSEELWKDSGAFKPERFLTADGELIKRDELIFFSSGKTSLLAVIRLVMNIKKHIIYPFEQKTNITCFLKLLIM
ncbi:cytochrome P450 2J6 [Strongylocentrotus purpuratus]|uniref:Cytochrome P450 n=1 Tax=Strongylocentrotus purpuratus TaxID=7668 RepID=A0A7M7SZV9_STRPU|nr:cytochrome P450 2J6 [Strongylocentrotus purpuratus]